jgi:hypothetical protein
MRLMGLALTWGVVAGCCTGTRADPVVLHVVPDSSRVQYFITHPISNVRNSAGSPSGKVRLTPTVTGWQIDGQVTVDLRALETGIDMRNRHVKSKEYLDVATFPLATFEFVAAEADSPRVSMVPVPAGAESLRLAPERFMATLPMSSPIPSPGDAPAGAPRMASPVEPALPSPEGTAVTARVAEPRTAEPAAEPRGVALEGTAPRVDVASLPTSWKAHAVGELTLHGVTRPLDVPVELVRDGERLWVHGQFSIFLNDYQVRRPSKFMLAAGKHADITVDLLWSP